MNNGVGISTIFGLYNKTCFGASITPDALQPPGKCQKVGHAPIITDVMHYGTSSSSTSPVQHGTSCTAPWRKAAGGTGLPQARPRSSLVNPGSAATEPWNKYNAKCGLYPQKQPINTLTGTVLILFSGPKSNPSNLQHALRKLNLSVEAYDLVDGADLLDDAIWDPIKLKLETGYYSAVFASPPCNSFSRLRGSDTTGPQRVRSVEGPERYGLDSNSPADKEYVRKHNLFAMHCLFGFNIMVKMNRVAVLEQPGWRKDEISMLNLNEFVLLLSLPGVLHSIRPQCPFGGKNFKATSFITFNVSVEDMSQLCCHSMKHWFRQGDGLRINARHPPSRGRHRYYLSVAEALADTSHTKRFVSTGLAHYPALLTTY